MDAHLIDSALFGHNWSSPASRELFSERARVARWVEVIAALARAQASLGLIPAESATAISAVPAEALDLTAIASATRTTAHSTLGLIGELQRHLPDGAREHVYVGATVQDITDTALSLELRAVGAVLAADLHHIELALIALVEAHRDTPMCGRTHGQPGAPITFGFKAASWLDEIGRSVERLHDGRPRWLVGQLGGAVGTLAFFGDGATGIELRRRFCAELALAAPAISWTSSRDRLGEFAAVVSQCCAGLARMANEVYSLQRAEIAELAEATTASVVGSITMPHKRNPESSEQIVALARLVRAQAGLLAETMVQEHERDARAWKAEWVAVPEICHYATAATALTLGLVDGLEVRSDMMAANLAASGAGSEQLLARLSAAVGKHRAQALLQDAYREARATGQAVVDCLPEEAAAVVAAHAADPQAATSLGAAEAMGDEVLAATRARHALAVDRW